MATSRQRARQRPPREPWKCFRSKAKACFGTIGSRAESFEVRAKDSPTAGGAFGYRVLGRRRATVGDPRGAAPPTFQPSIPQTQGVPTLPAHGSASEPAPGPGARGR